MASDYVQKVLRVNLSEKRTERQELDQAISKEFLGGAGIGAKVVWDETTAMTDPLSPENPLVFMTCPFNGTNVPSNSRMTVSSLSPLTGIWGEAHSGGSWPDELRRTGLTGIVVTGRADSPVYLRITDEDVAIVDARHLWGKDNWEADELLKQEADPKAVTLTIGQAGEKMVRVACLISGGRSEARAAARCGLGAVMGSKNLKAIVVRGSKRPGVHNREMLKESVRKHWASRITEYDPEHRNEIYASRARANYGSGKDPAKNFLVGEFEGFAEKYAGEVRQGSPLFCRNCRTSCFESAMVGKERRTMAGAMEMLGACCLVDDMETVGKAYHLCNRLGIDHKSTGATIAFAMECFERGLISKSDTDGIELTWGSGEAMVATAEKIGLRDGFGATLGEGTRRAAEIFGGNASEYAMHVKGLELPNWDPRSSSFRALALATGNIGPDPYSSLAVLVRHSGVPELGVHERDTGEGRFAVEGKGEAVARMQDFGAIVNSVGMCVSALSRWMPVDQHVPPSVCLEWLNAITGWDMTLEDFMRCGERIFNLQRMVNVRRGISRKDDTLPARLLTEKLSTGPIAGKLPRLHEMLGSYYSHRGWSEDGVPLKQKLAQLGLA